MHTTSTTTATTALAAAQQEAARATSWANEAAAGRRAAENERDRAVTATPDLREDLAVQTTSPPTATTDTATAQEQAARATAWENEAAVGCRAAENERKSCSYCHRRYAGRTGGADRHYDDAPIRPWQPFIKRLPAPPEERTKP